MASLNGDLPRVLGLTTPDAWDRALATVTFWLYRGLGLMALPVFWCIPAWRRHVWRVPCPSPGRTWVVGASQGEQAVARAHGPLLYEGYWPTSLSFRTPAPGAFPAPIDLPFVVETFFRRARPGRIVLVEGELWPGYLEGARRRGIPVVLVQARESRGLRRWARSGALGRVWLQGVGVRGVGDWGDLKAFGPAGGELRCVPGSVVLASARAGDTARLMGALGHLGWPDRGRLAGRAVLIAPRHAADVQEVVSVLQRLHVSFAQRSAGARPGVGVFVLDSMGELDACLRGAGIALIGGTWDSRLGGHSPATALALGIVVVHGPHTHANAAAYQPAERCVRTENGTPLALSQALDAGVQLGQGADRSGKQGDRRGELVASLPAPRPPEAESLYPWMVPFQGLWSWLVRFDRWRQGTPGRVGAVPVISVGALSAGGAGKTQLVLHLATRIPGAWVVSRGYARQAGGAVRVGIPGDPSVKVGWLGDEAEMLRRRGIPVVTAHDRNRAVSVAVTAGARVVILDDGFQSWGVHRDLDIVCVDGAWPDGGGLIPGGWLREDPSALARAACVCVVVPHEHPPPMQPLPIPPGIPIVRAVVRPRAWRHLGQRRALGALGGTVRVSAGIAHPGRFFELLQSLGLRVRVGEVVGDHGRFSTEVGDSVMTEKDAARFPMDAPVWALEVGLEIEPEATLRAILDQLGAGWSP